MRFRLRTLLIVLALGPPVLAGIWFRWAHQPSLDVSPSFVDVGTVTNGTKGTARFRFHNRGYSDLRVSYEGASNDCGLLDDNELSLAPGESKSVSVYWENLHRSPSPGTTSLIGRVEMESNDPRQPRFELRVLGQPK